MSAPGGQGSGECSRQSGGDREHPSRDYAGQHDRLSAEIVGDHSPGKARNEITHGEAADYQARVVS